jgi:hypothetical protein
MTRGRGTYTGTPSTTTCRCSARNRPSRRRVTLASEHSQRVARLLVDGGGTVSSIGVSGSKRWPAMRFSTRTV